MANPNQAQYGYFPQVRPVQNITNISGAPSIGVQGPPKVVGMPPIAGQDQQFHGIPPNNTNVGSTMPFMQGPPPRFSVPPPPASGTVNGFSPPASVGASTIAIGGQGVPSTASNVRQPLLAGNFQPPPSGQFAQSGLSAGTAPSVMAPILNGPAGAPYSGSLASQGPSSKFSLNPPLSQDLAMQRQNSQGSLTSAPPPHSQPSPAVGALPRISAPPVSSAVSGQFSAAPVGGHLNPPNELPVPFHGQAQYSHQIGASMKLTPLPTPSNSEPPSQRSSRGSSPVNEVSYDALEGQFTPGHGAPSPLPPQSAGNRPIPGPSNPGPKVPFLGPPGTTALSSAAAPPHSVRMPLPSPVSAMQQQSSGGLPLPRPGLPGPTGTNLGMRPPPVSGSGPGIGPLPPQSIGQQNARFQYMSGSAPPPDHLSQPGPPPGPHSQPGPPPGPFSQPGPPPGPFGQPGPPPGPFSQPGPPSGPSYNQPGLLGGSYSQSGPPAPGQPQNFNQGMPSLSQPPAFHPGPPTSMMGPPSALAGPPSGPTGAPGPLSGLPGQYSQTGKLANQVLAQPGGQGQNIVGSMAGDFSKMGIADPNRPVNLLQEKQLILPDGVETARPSFYHDHKKVNCNPDIFRCTLNAIPNTSALLNKARLPLGILIHPFKDLSQLPVIQSSVIVRCRSCRTYINPFVTFIDQRRWKCNLCFRVNELPDEFSFDPVTKTYGDPQRRPEIRSATIEFIAPSEYMLRPPQPAVYLFVLDVSFNAISTGYLRLFCQILAEEMERLPGDARTQIGFLCFDSSLYFFNLAEGLSQPQMLVVPDLEDVFLPCPENLLVNLHESKEMVLELLNQLPGLFEENKETGNALGTALQAAFKLMSATGGRMTVMQTVLPSVGQGALQCRESGSVSASKSSANFGPATDFYKKLALDCSAQQIAVDVFLLSGQYADIASVSCISKYSAGNVHYYPSFHTVKNASMAEKYESDFRRYLTRKIGFEAVMRIRCTKGLSIHTFHGNFFVRSTDLLSLPNVSPDAGFGMQMSIEDNLTESSNICFQAALLYTSSKGERRIRVHTLCVPITNQLNEVFASADQQAIAALLAKMAVDRTLSSSLEDARDAMMNACLDILSSNAAQIPSNQRGGALMVPYSLRLVPLLTLSMLKSAAFRLSSSVRIDERVFAHHQAKTVPMRYLLQNFYPNLYSVHSIIEENKEDNSGTIPKAPLLQLSSANIDRHGVYLMDQGENMYMLVGGAVPDAFCLDVFDVPNFISIPDELTDLPELENPTSERLRSFISHLMDSRPSGVTFLVIRDDSKVRHLFFQYMVEDRTENSMSYYEFLQFLQQKIKG